MLVHSTFDPDSIEWHYIFENQLGSGHFYNAIVPYQRGYNIFTRIFKFLVPILKSAGKEIGIEALKSTGATLTDMAIGERFEDSLKKNTTRGIHNLLAKGADATKGYGRKRKLVLPTKEKLKVPKLVIIRKKPLRGRLRRIISE